MIKGLYTASTGMMNQQKRMDIISNNLANINTTGFKKDGVVVESFKDVLTVKINDASAPGRSQTIGKMNLGVKLGEVYTNFKQGSFIETQNPLNIALQGEGFMTIGIEDPEGNLTYRYSRDGTFMLSNNGEIMTKDGYYLIGQEGNKITLNQGDIRIDDRGNIYTNDVLVNQMALVSFDDPKGLKKVGENLYEVDANITPNVFNGQVLQGYLEESNVNSIQEMVDMINVMRNYEANQKVIQTQDETLNKAVNDIGRL